MANNQITIDILADTRKLVQGVDQANGILGKLGAQASKLGALTTAFAGLGTAAAGFARIGREIGDGIGVAIDYADALDAARMILNDKASYNAYTKWLEGTTKSMGLSKSAANQLTTTFLGLGTGAGLSGKGLVEFGTSAAQMVADFRSAKGGTLDEAQTAITSALSGEYTPLKKYGILLNDTILKQYAYAKGLTKTTKGALDPQVKMLATHKYLMEEGGFRTNNFAETQGSAANQMQILNAELENAKLALGQAFLPGLTTVVTFINEQVIPAFKGLPEPLQAFIIALGGLTVVAALLIPAIIGLAAAQTVLNVALLPIIGTVALIILGIAALIAIGVLLYKNWDTIVAVAKDVWGKVAGFFQVVWDKAKEVFSAIWEGVLKPFLQIIGGIVAIVLNTFIQPFIGLWKLIQKPVTDAFNAVVNVAKTLGPKIWDAIKGVGTFLANIGSIFINVGTNIIKGIWAGVTGMANWLRDKFFQFFGGLVPDWAKKMLGIRSPSTVFAGIGENIVLGLAKGITGSMTVARTATQNMAAATTSGFTGVNGRMSGGVNITINAGIGTDSYELGRVVSQALTKFSGINGAMA